MGPLAGRVRGRALSLVLCAALLGWGCAGGLPWGEPTSVARWKQRASELRELDFREPIRFRWLTRSELPEVVREELLNTYSPDFVDRYRDAYVALGLLPRDLDLLQTLIDLLGEELVGLYSPHRRTMYVVRGTEEQAQDGALMIVIHELVHVLQHQHFPTTLTLLQELRHNDDVVLAIGSTVEGDASLTMMASDPNSQLGRRMADAVLFQSTLLADLETSRAVAARVPRLVRVSQVFPYAYGTPVAAQTYAEDGNRGLNARLLSPPLSTLHVRFPDEERAVEFIRLPLEALALELAPQGCELGHSNVAGMLTVRVFLEDYEPNGTHEALVRDWAGDRFVHVYCPDGWELAWFTRWSDARAAARFARRYRALAEAVAESAPLSGVPSVIEEGRTALVLTPGLLEQAPLLLQQSEIRSYRSFGEWKSDDCFPESPCPGSGATAQAGSSRQSMK